MTKKETGWGNTIQCLLVFCWLAILTRSDSYYVPYLVIGMAGVGCVVYRRFRPFEAMTHKKRVFTGGCAAFMSAAVAFANYKCVIPELDSIKNIIIATVLLLGGWVSFYEIMSFLARRNLFEETTTSRKGSGRLFFVCWLVLTTVYTTVLFGAQYPGVLTEDSRWQIEQILAQNYSNHHPFYHTQIIHLCLTVGNLLFDNMNAAVCTYSVFSICVMSLCFSYVVCTIDCIAGKRMLSIAVFLWYMMMPYHIMYSFTMWKDVFFGAAITFFVTSCYRMLRDVGNRDGNMAVMCLSSLGMCLLRSNGWIAFLATTILFITMFGKKQFRVAAMFVAVLAGSYILKYPVLKTLNVAQPDTIEALSIPAQQIARVLADGKELTEAQKELLSQVVDIDEVPNHYTGWLSDPIKELVRHKGNQELIRTQNKDFIGLYVQLGLKYPLEYLKAWIDQTRGYWNGGYEFWTWGKNVVQNDLDIFTDGRSGRITSGLDWYLNIWKTSPILILAVCIGFHVWIMVFCLYTAAVKKNHAALFVSIPILMVWGTLLIATPVFSEFRYIYALFCAMPLMATAALGKENESAEFIQKK